MKIWVIWNMKSFCNISKRLLILFVLSTFLIIPFVDSIACDDCINLSFQVRGLEISYSNITQADALSAKDNDEKSSPQKDIKSFCSICFNAAKMINTYDTNAVFQSGSLAFQPTFLTLLEPVFSLNKPPHN